MNLKFSNQEYQKIRFKTGNITCPVCGNKHRWKCSVTEDDGLCLCWNTFSDRQAKDGRYIHLLKHSSPEANQQFTAFTQENDNPVADIDSVNNVYQRLLESLSLNDSHRNGLIERGLSEESVNKNSYASVSSYTENISIVEALSKEVDLTGVPGFYFDGDKWKLHLSLQGFYVPYRDEHGRIQGMQIRKDGNAKSKYLTLSSANKGGTRPNSLLHFVILMPSEKIKQLSLRKAR